METPKKLTAAWLNENLGDGFSKTMVKGLANQKEVFKYRHGFYYRHGNDANKVAAKLALDFQTYLGLNINILGAHEHWATWPKDSYWEVKFQVVR